MTVTTDKTSFSTVDDFASAEEFMAAVDATIKPLMMATLLKASL